MLWLYHCIEWRLHASTFLRQIKEVWICLLYSMTWFQTAESFASWTTTREAAATNTWVTWLTYSAYTEATSAVFYSHKVYRTEKVHHFWVLYLLLINTFNMSVGIPLIHNVKLLLLMLQYIMQLNLRCVLFRRCFHVLFSMVWNHLAVRHAYSRGGNVHVIPTPSRCPVKVSPWYLNGFFFRWSLKWASRGGQLIEGQLVCDLRHYFIILDSQGIASAVWRATLGSVLLLDCVLLQHWVKNLHVLLNRWEKLSSLLFEMFSRCLILNFSQHGKLSGIYFNLNCLPCLR